MARVSGLDGRGSAVLEWTGTLSTPTLAGPRATYADVQPGVDLVVEATRTGFEQYLVVKARPVAGKAVKLESSIRLEGGLKATRASDGRVSVTAAAGGEVASSGSAAAWDAAVDSERAHPVTQRFVWDGPETGLARSLQAMPLPYLEQAKARMAAPQTTKAAPGTSVTSVKAPAPASTAPASPPSSSAAAPSKAAKPGRAVDAAAKAAKASAVLELAAPVVAGDRLTFDLSLGEDFWQDPQTVFPVVIDPTADFLWGFDTNKRNQMSPKRYRAAGGNYAPNDKRGWG
ncbi:MAG: hypothetical protein ACOH1Y_10145 [Propionicimonas sp.]